MSKSSESSQYIFIFSFSIALQLAWVVELGLQLLLLVIKPRPQFGIRLLLSVLAFRIVEHFIVTLFCGTKSSNLLLISVKVTLEDQVCLWTC